MTRDDTELSEVRRAVVLGLGKVTGEAAAEALLASDVEVIAYESAESDAHRLTAGRISSKGVNVVFGDPPESLLGDVDLVVPAPGVPPSHPFLVAAAAAGVPVWSELELGSRLFDGRLVAVTGTNGKTTVTSMMDHALGACGVPSKVAGNIGFPLSRAAMEVEPGTTIVCECSSAQLHFSHRFHPVVAILTNLGEDHYDWHPDRSHYFESKFRVTARQQDTDTLVFNATDEACVAVARRSAAGLAGFGSDAPQEVRRVGEKAGRRLVSAAGVAGNDLYIDRGSGDERLKAIGDIRVKGRHNVENVLAIASCASSLGLPLADVMDALAEFAGLPHRTAEVRTLNGVTYINDSKATNPHATLHALEGMERVILIAGGRAKGLDLAPLANAAPALKAVVTMGEAADQVAAVLADVVSHRASTVEEAVTIASSIATPGDSILLSPACSSVDQYTSYSERGDRFVAAVMKL